MWGTGNYVTNNFSTVGGGAGNQATGYTSTIPGGVLLSAESFGQVALGIYNTPHPAGFDANTFQASDRLLVIGNGEPLSGTRSDALVMLKNGNTTLNGQLTLSDGANPITLPNSDGADGQVLKTDGTGTVSWQSDNGAFATTATNLISNVGDLANDSFLFGSTSIEDVPGSDDDIKMLFDKSNGAFRVGSGPITWNAANTGNFSFAGGENNRASGSHSFVGGGLDNSSTGNYSTLAGGRQNISSGTDSAIGGGYANLATGNRAFIGGGISNSAVGTVSTVGGGSGNLASGNLSTILGGWGLLAESFGEVALGTWNTNVTPVSTNSFDSSDRLLVIGNGTADASRSDALVMLKSGDTDINGALVANSLGVDGSFTLPTADGFPTDVMQAAGGGVVNWVPEGTITSDKRLKTNIRDLSNVLGQLSQLDGYRFNWNEIRKNRDREEIGLIAQEVQELYPELVFTDPDGYLRVKYISFVPLLLEAVKELEERNAKLVAENDALEAKQSKDEERFAKLEGQLKLLMQQMLPAEAVGKD